MARIRDIAPVIRRGFVIFEVRRRSLSSNLRGHTYGVDLSSFTESGSGKRIAVTRYSFVLSLKLMIKRSRSSSTKNIRLSSMALWQGFLSISERL
jgi:hypothetical protein